MKLFKREKYLGRIRPFYEEEDLIKVITGVRRSGKSSVMQMIHAELIEKGVPEENIIYIDLDKRAYRKIKTDDQLESLIDSQTPKEGRIYLFIDEIQNVSNFEPLINGYRNEGRYSIFITGSNSYLLSGELVTKLTGRYIEFEIYTLTFDEYEEMKEFYHKEINPNPLMELTNFILEGGFPRTVLFDTLETKREYTRNVINEIFSKDIRQRNKIKNKTNFETVRNYVINNYGAATSVKAVYEALRKNGVSISRTTVGNYIQILLDAKILYECDRFDMKSRKSLQGERKYYLADLSFYFSQNVDNRVNYGSSLENIMYLYCASNSYSVSVGRIGKFECDFILRDNAVNYSYVQVSYSIADPATEEREYRPLEMIRDFYPKYVLTTDYLLQNRNGIHHLNIIDFMKNHQRF
jgi:predicted AAA+ superfamily ATPase